MPKTPVLGFIEVTLVTSKEEGGYVSTCLELGIASQGETVDEAFDNIRDATLVYLNTIERLGERQRVFRERGIKIRRHKPTGPKKLFLQPSQFASLFVTPIKPLPRSRKPALVGA